MNTLLRQRSQSFLHHFRSTEFTDSALDDSGTENESIKVRKGNGLTIDRSPVSSRDFNKRRTRGTLLKKVSTLLDRGRRTRTKSTPASIGNNYFNRSESRYSSRSPSPPSPDIRLPDGLGPRRESDGDKGFVLSGYDEEQNRTNVHGGTVDGDGYDLFIGPKKRTTAPFSPGLLGAFPVPPNKLGFDTKSTLEGDRDSRSSSESPSPTGSNQLVKALSKTTSTSTKTSLTTTHLPATKRPHSSHSHSHSKPISPSSRPHSSHSKPVIPSFRLLRPPSSRHFRSPLPSSSVTASPTAIGLLKSILLNLPLHTLPTLALTHISLVTPVRQALYRILDFRILSDLQIEKLCRTLAKTRILAGLVEILVCYEWPKRLHPGGLFLSPLNLAFRKLTSLRELTLPAFDGSLFLPPGSGGRKRTPTFRLTYLELRCEKLLRTSTLKNREEESALMDWLSTQVDLVKLSLPLLDDDDPPLAGNGWEYKYANLPKYFLPSLTTLHAPPSIILLLAHLRPHSPPLTSLIIRISRSLVQGLRPMELMGAVKGIMDLAIQFEFEGGGDGRTIGRTVGAVGACLGAGNNDGEEGEGEENTEVDLESLEFTIGDKDDEVLQKSVLSILPYLKGLQILRLSRTHTSSDPESDISTATAFVPEETPNIHEVEQERPTNPTSPSKKIKRPNLTIRVDPPRSPFPQSAAPVPLARPRAVSMVSTPPAISRPVSTLVSDVDDDMSEFYTPTEFATWEGFRFEVGQMLGAEDEDVYEDEVELPSPSPSLKPRFTPRRRSSQFLQQQRQNDLEREKNVQEEREERDERTLLANILALCPSLHTVRFLSGKEWVFVGEGGGVWVRE